MNKILLFSIAAGICGFNIKEGGFLSYIKIFPKWGIDKVLEISYITDVSEIRKIKPNLKPN